MVLIQTPSYSTTTSTCIKNELRMESRNIFFMAPFSLTNTKINECHQLVSLAKEKRHLFGDSNKEIEKWNGVNHFCQELDAIVETQKEKQLFEGKKVLEIGFATGLPSIYALEHGAKEVTVVYPSEEALKTHIEPTFFQNNANERVNYIFGDFDDLNTKIGNDTFDVILAPEIVYKKLRNFDNIHDTLKSLLSSNGIVLISGRSHYHDCDGNMSSMLDLIKRKNQFDVMERTTGSKSRYETAPRKLMQLMHKML